jgi:hypothetical protein
VGVFYFGGAMEAILLENRMRNGVKTSASTVELRMFSILTASVISNSFSVQPFTATVVSAIQRRFHPGNEKGHNG